MVTWVGSKNAITRASGVAVSILGRLPLISRKRSQIASFIRSVIKLILLRLDFWAVTSTLRVCSVVNQSSQLILLAVA